MKKEKMKDFDFFLLEERRGRDLKEIIRDIR